MKPTTNVVVGACLLSLLSACATTGHDAGRRDGLPSWHLPEIGIAYTDSSYGQTIRSARQLAATDALTLPSGPATISSIDRSTTWQPSGTFAFMLSYDLTPYLTLEANYYGNTLGGGADGAALYGATAFLHGTVTQNGIVQAFSSQASADVQWYGAALLGYWPVWRGLNLMARAGIEHTRTEISNSVQTGLVPCSAVNADGQTVSSECGADSAYSSHGASRNLPQIGAGISYRWKDWGKVTIEYERLANVGNAQTGRYSVNTVNLELSCLVTAFSRRD